MAQTSVLPATPSQSSPRERRPRASGARRAGPPADWPGPHLERLNAWVERRQRILAEIVQHAEKQRDA